MKTAVTLLFAVEGTPTICLRDGGARHSISTPSPRRTPGEKQIAAQEAEVVAAAEAELDAAYADDGTLDPVPVPVAVPATDDPVAAAADATRRAGAPEGAERSAPRDDGATPYTSDSGAAKGHGYVGHLIADLRAYGPTTWVNGKKVRGNPSAPSAYDSTYDGAWKPDAWKSEL